MLAVNMMSICRLQNPMSSVALLVGAYFVLDLKYPADAAATPECIQRYVTHGFLQFLNITALNGIRLIGDFCNISRSLWGGTIDLTKVSV